MADDTRNTAREQDENDAAQVHQEPPVAAGNDLDSRKRAAKTALAAALSTGDTDAADRAQKDLDAVNDELSNLERGTHREQNKDEAAKQRRADAAAGATRSGTPQGRTATPRDNTAAPATGGKNAK